MVADFSGMIPIRDNILLPDNNAQLSENTWLYRGVVRGFRHANPVYAIQYADTQSVYRIPMPGYDVEDFAHSIWLEFPDPYMSVIRNPTVGDEFNRYYFFPSDQYNSTGANPSWPAGTSWPPIYNTLDRIISGDDPYYLGIPNPTIAPGVVAPSLYAAHIAVIASTPGDTLIYLDSIADILPTYNAIDDTETDVYASATAASVAGNNTINIDTTSLVVGMTASSLTNPSTIFSGTQIISIGSGLVALSYGCLTAVAIGDEFLFVASGAIPTGTQVLDTGVDGTGNYVEIDAQVVNAGILVGDTIEFDASAQETRAYLYTYVSGYFEEGPPSPATVATGPTTGTWGITVTCPTADQMASRNLTTIRLYRTVTDANGDASYFMVDEIPITSPDDVISYSDSFLDSDITANLPLSTVDFTGPPSDLQGVVMMANGIAVGWSQQREIWFAAAYLPHAWPGAYALSVQYPIVGMTPNGASLNIVTEGAPSIATGVTPDTMTIGTIKANEPCIGRGSVIGAGEGAYYASPNGYQLLNSSACANQTLGLMDKEFWYSTQPQNFAAGRYGGSLVAFIKGSGDGDENGLIMDADNQNSSFSFINTVTPLVNIYNDELSGQIFYLTNDQVYQWNPPNGGALWSYKWKSKQFRFTAPQQFMAFAVYYDIPSEVTITPGVRDVDPNMLYDEAAQLLIVRIWGDGNQLVVREVQQSGETLLIPGGSKWTLIEFQLEGQVNVKLFKMASSIKELKAG